jgi:hypothetical protein
MPSFIGFGYISSFFLFFFLFFFFFLVLDIYYSVRLLVSVLELELASVCFLDFFHFPFRLFGFGMSFGFAFAFGFELELVWFGGYHVSSFLSDSRGLLLCAGRGLAQLAPRVPVGLRDQRVRHLAAVEPDQAAD